MENGEQIFATGGGAYMNPETRERIKEGGICVWLKADLDLLMKRVMKRNDRPLLRTADPEGVMRRLVVEDRYPVYAEADVTVECRDVQHAQMVNDVLRALARKAQSQIHCKPNRIRIMNTSHTTVAVALGDRSYDILIGDSLLARAGELVKPHLKRPHAVIVTDENVARHHLASLQASLSAAGVGSDAIVLAPGEKSKSYATLAELCDKLLAAGVERRDTIIAFGGGVIGDLAGFAAAILRRGVNFIQFRQHFWRRWIPLLEARPASTRPHGKNLVGAFHQPQLVLADLGLLKTLPRRELAAGYAEVVDWPAGRQGLL